MHINYLESMAVLLALKRFQPFVRSCHVLVRTDNATTMCYINEQGGGMASPALDELARELTLWCDFRLTSIKSAAPGWTSEPRSGFYCPLGLEALAHDWPREPLYAFPPLGLIPLCWTG